MSPRVVAPVISASVFDPYAIPAVRGCGSVGRFPCMNGRMRVTVPWSWDGVLGDSIGDGWMDFDGFNRIGVLILAACLL